MALPSRAWLVLLTLLVLAWSAVGQPPKPKQKSMSNFNPATKKYDPVVPCGDGKTYKCYRFRWTQKMTFQSAPAPANSTGVISTFSGEAYDTATKEKIGEFNSAGYNTARTTSTGAFHRIINEVLELGPEGDDAIYFAGSLDRSKKWSAEDVDMAITGGTGQFLGAVGYWDKVNQQVFGSKETNEYDFIATIWVPILPDF